MHVQPIFPGVFYISDREHSLLAGCPPEIVKVLMQRGLKSPQQDRKSTRLNSSH